ncbi:MAG: GIY-YIG nuclease family protein, partial [Cyclobacteriaceae bacterium]
HHKNPDNTVGVFCFYLLPYYTYILQSKRNLSFYKGSTDNLERRIIEHNSGKTPSTKRYTPWQLVWFAIKSTKQEAVVLEMKLKNLSVERTMEFIKKYPPPHGLHELYEVQR